MKYMIRYFLLLMPVPASAQQIDPLWVVSESTDGGLGNGKLPIVMVDSFHDVIVCGSTYSPGPVSGFITTKYTPDGSQIWQRRFDTFATDLITSAATDASGAVYVGGNSVNPFTGKSQFIVIKYAAAGDTLWQYSYDSIAGAGTYLSDLLLDSDQNLMVFGHYVTAGAAESGLLAVKLSSDGITVWDSTYEEGNYGYSGLNAGRTGDHFVFWAQRGSPEGLRFFAWQIDPEGATLETAQTDPYNDYFGAGYYIDKTGCLYIGDNSGEYKVTKFSGSGTTEWTYKKPASFINPNIIPAFLRSINTNTLGETFISGGFRPADSVGMIGLTSKLNPLGELLWEHEFTIIDIEHISPYRGNWVKEDLLLVTGLVVNSIDSNFYEFFLTTYDSNGFVKGGISDIAGKRNWPASIAPDGEFFYIAGNADPEVPFSEPSKQFLCKYAMEDIISTSIPFINATALGQLTVYPNPFVKQLKIMCNYTDADNRGILEIYDMQGNAIYFRDVFLQTGINTFEIESFEALSPGIYGISLRTAQITYNAKAIKIP